VKRPELYYEVQGDNGPYLLLVHGLLSSRAQWMPNLDALKTFCRPVVIELFGHGRSPSPENPECYTPGNYVQEFEKIRQDLGAEEWFICGQSLGASLTLLYALHHPETVVAQIFTNSRSALSDVVPEIDTKILAQRIKNGGREILQDFPLHPAKSHHLPKKIKNALIEDIERATLQGFKNTLLHTVFNTEMHKLLPRTKVPTLLIAGRFEKQFKPFINVADELIPNLEILVLDGGHAVNIDAADRFNQAVKEHITKHKKIGGPHQECGT